jgi:hypothetical protein
MQEGSTILKMIIRITSATVAALALIAGTSAFTNQPTARLSHAQPASARHASPQVATHPMIPARLPAGPAALAAAGGIGNIGIGTSSNWAGYAVSKKRAKFRKISATFFVPFLNCAVTKGQFFSSAWVGLDGLNPTIPTVEQDGISADCNGTTPVYAAWWEMFPNSEVQTAIVIRPGDSIKTTVTFNPVTNKFQLALRDNTNGHQFAVARRCPVRNCARASAEVISEAPFVGSSQASLADYGAESFASISISSNKGNGGILSKQWTPTMIMQIRANTNVRIASPTALRGASFDNYWIGPN